MRRRGDIDLESDSDTDGNKGGQRASRVAAGSGNGDNGWRRGAGGTRSGGRGGRRDVGDQTAAGGGDRGHNGGRDNGGRDNGSSFNRGSRSSRIDRRSRVRRGRGGHSAAGIAIAAPAVGTTAMGTAAVGTARGVRRVRDADDTGWVTSASASAGASAGAAALRAASGVVDVERERVLEQRLIAHGSDLDTVGGIGTQRAVNAPGELVVGDGDIGFNSCQHARAQQCEKEIRGFILPAS